MYLFLQNNDSKLNKLLISASLLIFLSACQTANQNVREDKIQPDPRLVNAVVIQEWRKCRDDAFELDTKARETADSSKYIASANLIIQCENKISEEISGSVIKERFRSYGLAVQNYIKGGDTLKASEHLTVLKQKFKNQDLYFDDGSSFITTMEILTGQKDRGSINELDSENISNSLRSELKRIRYWKNH